MSRLFFIGLLFFVTCSAVVYGGDDVVETQIEEHDIDTSESEGSSRSEASSSSSSSASSKASSSSSSSSSSSTSSASSDESSQDCDTDAPPPPSELTCGENERKDDCPADCPADYCPRSEAEAKKLQSCLQPKVCPPPKCKCIFNYRRARNGTCIPTRSCPPFKCKGVNEEFNPCPPLCPTDDCSQASPSGKCPLIGRIGIVLTCNPTCRCKKGYWRKNGICVPYAQCSTSNPKPGEVIVVEPDTLRCGVNEEVRCVTTCPPERTCKRQTINVLCALKLPPCKNKCVCKKGYFRNYLGQCITKAQCDQCSKPNEFYSCGSACDNECKTIGKQSRTNCPIINIVCNKRCYCEDGYARDDNGNCIPVDQCKKSSLVCGSDEEEICSTGCPPPKTCENRNVAYSCLAGLPCKPVCECKAEYYRNAIGECITVEECAKCSKPNEFFTCGSACDNVCKTIKERSRTNCPIKNKTCNKRCYCKDGYARDDKGNCIPIDQCNKPKPKKCCANEDYVLGKSCPPDTCIALVARFKCDSNEPDKYRCRCKPGYFRLKSGSPCVPMCECPQMANSPDCV